MSSETVFEIAKWPASEAYKADPSVINPALEILANSAGALKIFHGLQYEDKSTGWLVIAWDKLSSHQALIADKAAYATLGGALKPSLGGALSLYHVAFQPVVLPIPHFTAGITEFAVQTLREGKDNAALEGLVWNEKVNPDGTIFSVGKVVEKEREYVLLKGWDSYEAHQAARSGGDERVAQFVAAVHQIVSVEVAHVKLTAYKN